MLVFKLKKKDGFTLVELLIVMMIVGMMSTLAVNGYVQYRKSALLELNADNIVSQIYTFKEKALRGDFGSDRADFVVKALEDDEGVIDEKSKEDAKCFGLSFVKNDDVFDLVSYEMNFSGKQKFDGVKWNYVGCGEVTDPMTEIGGLERDPEIYVEEVALIKDGGDEQGEMVDEDFDMRFSPPEGKVEIAIGGGQFFDNFSVNEKLRVRVKYGINASDEFKRDIIFDLNSLTAEIRRI